MRDKVVGDDMHKTVKNKNIKREILKRQFGVNNCTYYYKGHSDLFGHYKTISVPSRNQSYKSHSSSCAELSATEQGGVCRSTSVSRGG